MTRNLREKRPCPEDLADLQGNKETHGGESPGEPCRKFYVRAKSTNAVRRALYRAPGGVRIVGRYDRETIECLHTMDSHSIKRHWPVIKSRLAKAGLVLVGPAQEP